MEVTKINQDNNQLKITLFAVFANTIISTGFLLYCICQGLIGRNSSYSDSYYGSYIGIDGEGSLLVDMLTAVVLIAILITIFFAIKKIKSRFFIIMGILLLILIPCAVSYLGYLSSIIICIFGYFQTKKAHFDSQCLPKKTYIITVMCSIYAINTIFYAVNLLVGAFGFSETDGNEVPRWVIWGTGSANTGVDMLLIINNIVPFILLLIATIIMYLARKGSRNIQVKLGAVAFLLYCFFVTIYCGETDWSILEVVSPEILLSIYLLFCWWNDSKNSNQKI